MGRTKSNHALAFVYDAFFFSLSPLIQVTAKHCVCKLLEAAGDG